MENDFITVARVAEVLESRPLALKVGGRQLALFNLAGEIYALDGFCPHKGAPLGEGTLENGTVFCPLHGWQFDIRTGACFDNPAKPATCLPVRIVDGEVQVQLYTQTMKSAYELAMERLSKDSPTVKLTDEQKKQLAELDSIYSAKIAERELFLKEQLVKAETSGDYEAIEQLEKQIASEKKRFQSELEEKKDQIRQAKS